MPSLESYIAGIYYDNYSDPSSTTKRPRFGPVQPASRLRKSRTNHILIYRGSFNPSHRGHMEVLRHGFFQGGDDLNITAAFIVPRDDDEVVRNFGGCSEHVNA